MTGKRFTYLNTSKNHYIGSFFCNGVPLTNKEVVDLLNENEELKQEYQKLKHRHSLLYDVCIDAECDRDSYRKDIVSLEKENKQLKKENKRLKRSIAPSVVVDANTIAETIATCRGITVEEYLEEVEKEYRKEGEKE